MPTPRGTYRIQLRPGFGFAEAASIADYLASLGVSHLYASPYLQAAPGSTHGYDVVDPSRVSAELGGEAGHRALCEALGRAGLGQVLDIVPNHMAIGGAENAWWWDVLRNGPASAYAPYFDVDWDPPEPKLRNSVLMPVLGDHYGRELEAGRIRVRHEGGRFTIEYGDRSLPAAPRSTAPIVAAAADAVAAGGGGVEGPGVAVELGFLARSLSRLPEPALSDEASRERRRLDLEAIDRRLAELVASSDAARAAIDGAVERLNGDVDALDEMLTAQNYRLAYWRTAGEELDYRRFFDIDSLAGLRTEDERVFRAVHVRVTEWLEAGVLDGVRVDHPDGLRRPADYLERLRATAPGAWIVVEKIVMPDERLRDWPVDGTTGYEFLNRLGGVFVDPAGAAPLTSLWRELTGDDRDFHAVAREARRDVLREVLAADLNRLANIFVRLCERTRRYRDFTRRELRQALEEVAVHFPVYRTYVTEKGAASAADRAVIGRAVTAAKTFRPELDGELFDFLARVLSGAESGDEARGLRMRFQQLTGPVAAKGEEDTAFYRYLRFAALNEVAGDPGRWGTDVATFHEGCREAAARWPGAMTTLSTHDTKRSEDVRARLFVVSEMAEEWARCARTWMATAGRYWPTSMERDPAAEYLFFQTWVGAWPVDADRLAGYMEKATREAKLRTSWIDPDPTYDEALEGWVRTVHESPVAGEVEALAARLVEPGRIVALAQKLVQLTAPGVPDIYQGTELWDLSLVDPDNRRPVDFEARRALLHGLAEAEAEGGPDPEAVLLEMDAGLPKLWVVRQALRSRCRRAEAFGAGASYESLTVSGAMAEHAFGYVRGGAVAVLVPRLVLGLARAGDWGDTEVALPAGRWRNLLTGEEMDGGVRRVGDVLARFPVALLEAAAG